MICPERLFTFEGDGTSPIRAYYQTRPAGVASHSGKVELFCYSEVLTLYSYFGKPPFKPRSVAYYGERLNFLNSGSQMESMNLVWIGITDPDTIQGMQLNAKFRDLDISLDFDEAGRTKRFEVLPPDAVEAPLPIRQLFNCRRMKDLFAGRTVKQESGGVVNLFAYGKGELKVITNFGNGGNYIFSVPKQVDPWGIRENLVAEETCNNPRTASHELDNRWRQADIRRRVGVDLLYSNTP